MPSHAGPNQRTRQVAPVHLDPAHGASVAVGFIRRDCHVLAVGKRAGELLGLRAVGLTALRRVDPV